MDTFFQVLSHCAWRQIMQINGVLPFPIGSAAIFRDIRLFPKKNYPTESTHVSSALSFFGDFNGRKSSIIRAINGHVVAGRF